MTFSKDRIVLNTTNVVTCTLYVQIFIARDTRITRFVFSDDYECVEKLFRITLLCSGFSFSENGARVTRREPFFDRLETAAPTFFFTRVKVTSLRIGSFRREHEETLNKIRAKRGKSVKCPINQPTWRRRHVSTSR